MEYNEISKEVKAAADAFLEGTASAEQERQLTAFFEETDGVGLSPDMRAIKTMLEGSKALSDVSFDTEAFADSCRRSRHQGAWMYRYGGVLAAVAAIVVAAFVFAPEKQEVFGYDINGQAIMNMDQALDNMISMNLLSELDNSTNEAESILNALLGE